MTGCEDGVSKARRSYMTTAKRREYERSAREQNEGQRTGQFEEGKEGKVSQRSDYKSEKIKWRPLERGGRTLMRSSREIWIRR